MQGIMHTLRLYYDHVDAEDDTSDAETVLSKKDILQSLIIALENAEPV